MRNLIILFVAFFISLSIFFSCEKSEESNDKTKPIITISDNSITDTLYIGGNNTSNMLTISFSDNEALSSYKINVLPSPNFIGADIPTGMDTIPGGDSLALNNYTLGQRKDIFGVKEITIRQYFSIPATFQKYSPELTKNHTYNTRTGLYQLAVVVADRAGNIDSIVSKEVVLVYVPRSSGGNEEEEDG